MCPAKNDLSLSQKNPPIYRHQTFCTIVPRGIGIKSCDTQDGDCVFNYLDFSNEFVVLFILCVWEFIDLYFMLLYLFHYLTNKERNQDERNTDHMSSHLSSNTQLWKKKTKKTGISLLKIKSIYSHTML